MGVINDIQKIGRILQQENIELYKKLLAIQERTLKTMEENSDLKKENNELKEALKIKGQIRRRSDAYWIEIEEDEKGPYCSKCYEEEKRLINLIGIQRHYFKCPRCDLRLRIPISGARIYRV